MLAIGFDGLVASAGGYVEIDGDVLSDRRFPPALAARTLEVLDAHDIAYVLEAAEGAYGRTGIIERMRTIMPNRRPARSADPLPVGSVVNGPIIDSLEVSSDLGAVAFAKVTYFDSPQPIAVLAGEIGPEVSGLPSSIEGMRDRAGELYLRGIDKATGIALVIEHFDLNQSDVVAVGDGPNDLEMLEYAGTAVAIAGAPTELLALADLVAATPAEEGLVAAFDALGLTESSSAETR